MKSIVKEFKYGNHSVKIETGEIARQADSAVVVSIGGTSVLVTVVGKKQGDEGRDFFPLTAGAPPHDWLNNRGGSIGYGMPVAISASVACPERKVLLLEGDGSGMNTVQSLWTMAREELDIIINEIKQIK